MIIGVPRELADGECRVAIVPESVGKLSKAGFEVVVQRGAGGASCFSDEAYEKAGARLVEAAEALGADIVLKVEQPTLDEADHLKEGKAVFSLFEPWNSEDLVAKLNSSKITSFSMQLIPRITRAQSMDVLSSQATISGYKAVLLAAERLPRILPMLVTAAGTLAPARALVIGAGVAGLMAIGTARRLGAIVEGFDVRLAAAEQVESMGAKFVGRELLEEGSEDAGGYAKAQSADKEAKIREFIRGHVAGVQIVITTAAIPKRKAPILITEEAVKGMKPGSVIVDLAAESGGNCELTKVGEVVEAHGVTIIGPRRLPATVPTHASQMYSRNITTLLLSLVKDGEFGLDFEDEVVAAACVTHAGETRSAP
ncbi:MAG: Re/Si-specific NAD(P)(+) transhydrogenase subunit alpha [Planctomycetota bacterium]